MKKYLLFITFFLMICLVDSIAQTESLKAGTEYNVLDAWAGIWNVHGVARDSISGHYYQVDWTLKGKRILNGFALEISHQWITEKKLYHLLHIQDYAFTQLISNQFSIT